MDELEDMLWVAGLCILRGDIALARVYAGEYALARDARPTDAERVAALDAWAEVARA